MARSGAPRGTPKAPRLPAEAGEAREDRAAAALLAATGASDVAEDPEELAGTVAFLDAVAELSPAARARAGFRFKVYRAEGPRQYLPDSDWGETVPTEDEIAQRYGPGSYVVQVGKRRRGQGGGWGSEIRVRIARDAGNAGVPAGSSSGLESRLFAIVEQIALGRASHLERDDEPAAASLPPELAVKLDEFAAAAATAARTGDASGIPEWAQPFLAKLLESFVPTPAAAPSAPPATGA